MYKALYRKWRPKTFDDVVGQSHITEILKKEVSSNRISHAYLFTGSRGVGKTTCAKILARAANCESPILGNPCGNCTICKSTELENELDIVEIDAASNNGVENIREMREELIFTPSRCKYRVYIVDEVHMLSIGAFNAFLKTLEEPPNHVIFILATTEVHKLPLTIISRCQKFGFYRISSDEIYNRLKYVCDKENIEIEDSAAKLIAAASDGAMRDALSILDQCYNTCNGKIEEIFVKKVLGIASEDFTERLAKLLLSADSPEALKYIDKLYNESKNMVRLCEEITKYFRNIMVDKITDDSKSSSNDIIKNTDLKDILYCLEVLQNAYKNISLGTNEKLELEIAAVKICYHFLNFKRGKNNLSEKSSNKSYLSSEISENISAKFCDEIKNSISNDEEVLKEWYNVLEEIKKESNLKPLYLSLKDSSAYERGNYILIKCSNSLAFEILRKPEYRANLKKSIHKVLGKPYSIGPYEAKPKNNKELKAGSNLIDSFIKKAISNDIKVIINEEEHEK